MRSSTQGPLSCTRRLATASALPFGPARSALEPGEAAPCLLGRPARERVTAVRWPVAVTRHPSWSCRLTVGGPGLTATAARARARWHVGPGHAHREPRGGLLGA